MVYIKKFSTPEEAKGSSTQTPIIASVENQNNISMYGALSTKVDEENIETTNNGSFIKIDKSYIDFELQTDNGIENKRVYLTGASITSCQFSGRTDIISAEVGGDIKTLGASSFKGCTNMTGFTADNVTEVKDSALMDCSNLKKISLRSAKTVGPSAFKNCSSVTEFYANNIESFEWCSATYQTSPFYNFSDGTVDIVLPHLKTLSNDVLASSRMHSFSAVNLKTLDGKDGHFLYYATVVEVRLGKLTGGLNGWAFREVSDITDIYLNMSKQEFDTLFKKAQDDGIYFANWHNNGYGNRGHETNPIIHFLDQDVYLKSAY